MEPAAIIAVVLFLAAAGIAILTFVLGASPWFWFGTWIGSEGDPNQMKQGCGALVKWGIGLPALLFLAAVLIIQCSDATL